MMIEGYDLLPVHWTLRSRIKFFVVTSFWKPICAVIGHRRSPHKGIYGCIRCFNRKVFLTEAMKETGG